VFVRRRADVTASEIILAKSLSAIFDNKFPPLFPPDCNPIAGYGRPLMGGTSLLNRNDIALAIYYIAMTFALATKFPLNHDMQPKSQ
jgi:hypothetical protein